jgi:type I restriction enzyme R subunit
MDYLLPSEPVDIMDTAAMEEALKSLGTPAARADAIANATKRTITERMDEDPALFRKFSELIEETIRSFRDHMISELEYLNKMRELRNEVVHGTTAGVPQQLATNEVAQAYYRVLSDRWSELSSGPAATDVTINLSLKLDSVIRDRAGVVDWRLKQDVQKGIRADIDDVFFEESQAGRINLDWSVIDELAGELMRIAKSRLP